jgi:hypothetical protein
MIRDSPLKITTDLPFRPSFPISFPPVPLSLFLSLHSIFLYLFLFCPSFPISFPPVPLSLFLSLPSLFPYSFPSRPSFSIPFPPVPLSLFLSLPLYFPIPFPAVSLSFSLFSISPSFFLSSISEIFLTKLPCHAGLGSRHVPSFRGLTSSTRSKCQTIEDKLSPFLRYSNFLNG